MSRHIGLVLALCTLVLTAGSARAQVYQYASGVTVVAGVRGLSYQNPNNGASAYRYRTPWGGVRTGYYNPTTGNYATRARGPYGRAVGTVGNTATGDGTAWARGYRGAYGVRWW